MISRLLFAIPFYVLIHPFVFAQPKQISSSGNILQQLEKLNTLGSVLYIAAHPDDENTQLISYMANGMHLRTGYLSATRGDGGQNLIGTEIKESLGVIRTQELLSARKVDGGEQFFSRAIDFGYSKDPDETFNKWNREEVLKDFVWVIRKFRPDVIVTRFNIKPGTTHGHHTASAILAKEAFQLSHDSTAFPDQLDYIDTWEVKKIFWNKSNWFYRRTNQSFDPDDFIKIDVGQYNSYLGQSYTEISARSRSMHKSQGFGRVGTRGSDFEYLEQWGGDRTEEIFEGIDISWDRLSGSEKIKYQIKEAMLNFDPKDPSLMLPNLLEARKEIEKLQDKFWKKIKLKEIDEIILAATGTFIEFISDQPTYAAGDSINIDLEVINRSQIDISLASVSFSRWNDNYLYEIKLVNNQVTSLNYSLLLSKRVAISNPYWLSEPSEEGMYRVANPDMIGLSENAPVIVAKVALKIEDQFLNFEMPVTFKESDRVKGEVYTPLAITPAVMVNLDKKALIYPDLKAKQVSVVVVSGKPSQSGKVSLEVPINWRVEPQYHEFSIDQKGEEQVFNFSLFPSKEAGVASIKAIATINGVDFDKGQEIINYDHFPQQMWFPQSETKVVKLDLKKNGSRIGYIMGAGDEVPYALEQMGYSVEQLEKENINGTYLKRFDAVILGIRAFNTLDWLSYKNKELFEYTENGGTVIVQYNTFGTVTKEIAPYSIKISRDRVAVEEAEVRFLNKKHEVLNLPNKITSSDFDGWVQERGLYFSDEYDANFESVLSMNDPNETPKDGSLLIAKHGKGFYIYTGISFFRELPAGVPGAFRLMANLISIGNNTKDK